MKRPRGKGCPALYLELLTGDACGLCAMPQKGLPEGAPQAPDLQSAKVQQSGGPN
jgi:hypothetical protein